MSLVKNGHVIKRLVICQLCKPKKTLFYSIMLTTFMPYTVSRFSITKNITNKKLVFLSKVQT